MIYLVCQTCKLAFRTVGEPGEVSNLLMSGHEDWYPNKYPCPTFECSDHMQLVENIDSSLLAAMTVRDLTPVECFQAFYGLGLPEERECKPDTLRTALVGKTVVGVGTQAIPRDRRCVVQWILLNDGTRIYLGSGVQGAVAYRIAPTRSFVKEISDGNG